jgi:hypothetical protein
LAYYIGEAEMEDAFSTEATTFENSNLKTTIIEILMISLAFLN